MPWAPGGQDRCCLSRVLRRHAGLESALCQGPRDDWDFPRWRRWKEQVESEKLSSLRPRGKYVMRGVGGGYGVRRTEGILKVVTVFISHVSCFLFFMLF